jgi:putative ABC transport system ATP-binding protein
MIELAHVSRTFEVGGQPVHALSDVTLDIGNGDYVSIMGPSGSGKSTLLNLVGCLDRPTAGSYRLDDEKVGRLSEVELSRVRRHKIGFIFQFFHLVPRLTAAENVELPMIFAGTDPRERKRRAERALAGVGLVPRAGHRPDQLSGGERQRVAIARAVVMEPSILLADEPTGNLDSTSGDEIVALIEEMNRGGITLIVVTHDPSIGGRARRRIRLSDGAVVSDETGPAPGGDGRRRR